MVAQLRYSTLIIGLVVIQLVNHEDHRLVELLRITELVDRADLNAILGVQYHQRGIRYVQGGNRAADKVVRSRTIDEIQFTVLPFYAENCREHRVTIFFLDREIIRYCIFIFNRTSTFYNSTLVKHRFSESGFSGARTSQDGDVLDFICLVHFHDIRF